jgi:hypothetical protein
MDVRPEESRKLSYRNRADDERDDDTVRFLERRLNLRQLAVVVLVIVAMCLLLKIRVIRDLLILFH